MQTNIERVTEYPSEAIAQWFGENECRQFLEAQCAATAEDEQEEDDARDEAIRLEDLRSVCPECFNMDLDGDGHNMECNDCGHFWEAE